MDVAVFRSPEDIVEKPLLIDTVDVKQRVRRAQVVIDRENHFVGDGSNVRAEELIGSFRWKGRESLETL